MSGHNKWSTIKHKKGKEDAKRGKIFTKLIKEITVAARGGGGDPGMNPRLRTAIATAKAANMPADNVTRAIKKGTGELEGVSYDEISYEGYGPGGVAVIVDALTDNKNRTVAEVRHIFGRYNGNMGETGSVGWMFDLRGLVTIDGQPEGGEAVDEDELMMAALEAGAEDVKSDSDAFEVFTQPGDLETVRAALEEAGYAIASAEIAKIPQNTVKLEGKHVGQLIRLIDALEDSEDVQDVWANYDIDDSELEALS